ncbi:MAG: VOC family protein [Actinomycetales bacterium]|nr:VOC family protein [Actinomycetales bacterium]
MSGIHHLTLTVSDRVRSAQWYQDVLGPATVVHREGPGWRRIRMAWPEGLVIGVTEFEQTEPVDRFDPRRVGLDHIGISCPSGDEVHAWSRRLDELGVEHGPVEDVPYGWAVTARDPDGIAVEFFCPKPSP